MNEKLFTLEKDARGLSSGTVSYLVACTKYDVVDAIQAEFVEFCAEMEGRFENWQQAWNAFKQVYDIAATVNKMTLVNEPAWGVK